MRILVLNQFFWPDTAPTGALAADVVRALAARGHRVTVLCARNRYAQISSAAQAPPAEIVRVACPRYSRRAGGRLLSWTSFLLAAAWRSLRLPPPDVVLAMTTPPGLSRIGLLLKRRYGARLWIWEMDLYPDVAAATGTLAPASRLYRAADRILTAARRQADGILALGECMKERLVAKGVDPARIVVAENWADAEEIQPRPFPVLPPLKLLYSGNLGLAHDTETIFEAIRRLGGAAPIQFRFAGDGALRAAFEGRCRASGLGCVSFEPYCERERLAASLADCHIGLVTLRPACAGTVVPSKLYPLLAAGRPVLFIGPEESTAARLIERHGCGWVVRPGRPDAAAALLCKLAAEPQRIFEAGARGRRALEQHYDVRLGVARIVGALEAPSAAACRPATARPVAAPIY